MTVKLTYGELWRDVQAKTSEDFSESINEGLDRGWDGVSEEHLQGIDQHFRF